MRQAYAFCFAQKEGCRISKIVFKQWLYAPNKKSTPKTVTNMLQYIATRDGVELNPLPLDQELAGGRFVDYIATRPGAAAGSGEHGLFGKLMGMKTQGDIARLEQARNYVERLAQGKTAVYNAVISLEEADALEKGLDTRGGWEELIRTNIHEIARGMGIPHRTLEYCCAVHLEQGHPHLHLMYWDTAQKVGVNFIQPEASNTIWKKLIRNVFQEEIGELMAQKDEAYKAVLEQADQGENSVLKNQRKLFGTLTLPEIYQMSIFPNRISENLKPQAGGPASGCAHPGAVGRPSADQARLPERVAEIPVPAGTVKKGAGYAGGKHPDIHPRSGPGIQPVSAKGQRAGGAVRRETECLPVHRSGCG